eukprot:2317747-Pleurochrysis_carterae.AAC.5
MAVYVRQKQFLTQAKPNAKTTPKRGNRRYEQAVRLNFDPAALKSVLHRVSTIGLKVEFEALELVEPGVPEFGEHPTSPLRNCQQTQCALTYACFNFLPGRRYRNKDFTYICTARCMANVGQMMYKLG